MLKYCANQTFEALLYCISNKMTTKWKMTKEQERQFLSEVIELYQSLPVLWDVKSKIYHDRKKKTEAYQILVKKYREKFPGATREDVTKKINVFRSNYRKELKKYHQFVKSSEHSSYEPSLWYFKKFTFLNSHFKNQDNDAESDTFIDDTENNPWKVKVNDTGSTGNKSDIMMTEVSQNKNLGASPLSIKQEFDMANDIEMESSNHPTVDIDEYYHWAMAFAADLRKMDRIQQIYAKKAIAEILMEGQLGLLHRDSIKINEDPL